MVLTIDEVRKIAALARLRLSAEEEEKFVPQLGRIVAYIDQLRLFETAQPKGGEGRPREDADRIEPCLPADVVLRNAPEKFGELLVVPQVKAADDV
jgi:aspartyl-tRNA(Asn)/glutamyl-tRNA(Gln) amidotransferase subunit C